MKTVTQIQFKTITDRYSETSQARSNNPNKFQTHIKTSMHRPSSHSTASTKHKKKKKTITKLKNHYFATTKFLGFRWHKKRPTKNSKQQSKFKGQRRKLQRKVRKRGHSRISSGVENWRRPVGLLLNFPLPIVSFNRTNATLRFSNPILLLVFVPLRSANLWDY